MIDIDYEETIKNTLLSVMKFLNRRADNAYDVAERRAIVRNAEAVLGLAMEMRRDRMQHIEWNNPAGFVMSDFPNNDIYRAFNEFLNAMHRFYKAKSAAEREQSKKELLKSVKNWNYAKSNNIFKDFYYPFVASKMFATRVRN